MNQKPQKQNVQHSGQQDDRVVEPISYEVVHTGTNAQLPTTQRDPVLLEQMLEDDAARLMAIGAGTTRGSKDSRLEGEKYFKKTKDGFISKARVLSESEGHAPTRQEMKPHEIAIGLAGIAGFVFLVLLVVLAVKAILS